jgi:hypothetical protein
MLCEGIEYLNLMGTFMPLGLDYQDFVLSSSEYPTNSSMVVDLTVSYCSYSLYLIVVLISRPYLDIIGFSVIVCCLSIGM